MGKPADYLQREEALDPNRSFAVTAPAGSGKTEILTQRVLRLLPLCENPEEVVCLTFTKKAAGEMRERITGSLFSAMGTPEPEDDYKRQTWVLAQAVIARDKEMRWGLLQNPSRLRITTIDGFCRSMALQMPLESGLGGIVDTLDQPVIAYQRACHNFFKRIEGQDEDVAASMESLYLHLDNDISRIETLLIGMLHNRMQWLPKVFAARNDEAEAYIRSAFEMVTNESLEAVYSHCLSVESQIMELVNYASANLVEKSGGGSSLSLLSGSSSLPSPTIENLDAWRALGNFLLTGKGTWRKTVNAGNGFPANAPDIDKGTAKLRKCEFVDLVAHLGSISGLREKLMGVNFLPDVEHAEKDWSLIRCLTTVLPLLAAELEVVFKEMSSVDFTAITAGAINALGSGDDDFSELTLKLDYGISHILIDEFQDTSMPQLLLLEKLTEGWQYDDGRTVFIVGDGMQSIYSFRDANVGIFLGLRANGLPNVEVEPLDLTVNFRSTPEVVNWVNETFVDAFPEAEDISRGAVPYSPSEAFRPSVDNSGVFCHAIVDSPNTLESADKVVSLVQEARDKNKDQVIAILVKSRPHLKEILPALKKAGLKWQATEIDTLGSKQAVIDMMTLTKVLNDPSDRIAWLSFLRAPWCGLSLNDLHAVSNDIGQSCIVLSDDHPLVLSQIKTFRENASISNEGKSALTRIYSALTSAWDSRRRKSLRSSVEGLWISLGGPACLYDSSDMADIRTYLDLVDRHSTAGQITKWGLFESGVDALYAAPDPDADPKLQVMTIHKSKGLEFDTVIIPGAEKGARNDDKALLLTQEWLSSNGEPHLLMATLGASGEGDTSLYRFLGEEKRIRSRLENNRLLYVGATRAINTLHIVANVSSDKKGDSFKKISSNTLLSNIWEVFKGIAEATVSPNANSEGEEDHSVLDGILRLPSNWKIPKLAIDDTLFKYRGHEIDDGSDNIPSSDQYYARLSKCVGVITHRVLCAVGKDCVGCLSGSEIENRKPSIRAQLLQMGLPYDVLAGAVERVIENLTRTLADEKGRWLLDNTHEESRFEYEVCTWDDGDNKTHIIDRTFIEDGVRWIVDYKSSEPKNDETLESFLDSESQSYGPQLDRYKSIFKKKGEANIVKALYFPAISVLHKVA